MNERELAEALAGIPRGFEYKDETREDRCQLLVSAAETNEAATLRAIDAPARSAVRLGRPRFA
jgi:hypothetical protein